MEGAIPRADQWLLFLAQLPAAPSSARVAVWRRLRAAGAASVLNGAWVLPKTKKHMGLLSDLAQFARDQGGQATVFTTDNLTPSGRDDIMSRFQADRAREYEEFDQRVQVFLAEIERESLLEKFTFVELEEIEDDFTKLSTWLDKITARDFFPGSQASDAKTNLGKCSGALRLFAERVYATEGVSSRADDPTAD